MSLNGAPCAGEQTETGIALASQVARVADERIEITADPEDPNVVLETDAFDQIGSPRVRELIADLGVELAVDRHPNATDPDVIAPTATRIAKLLAAFVKETAAAAIL